MSHNSITGDKIATKPSKEYSEHYDAIFRKDAEVRVIEAECCPMCDVVIIDDPPKIKFRAIDPLQDYYRDPDGNQYSVARLVDEAKGLKPFDLPIAGLDLSAFIWNDCNIYQLAFHCQKVIKADLRKPIILDWNGCIADGRHRIIKALIDGRQTIKAVRMTWSIEPCRRAE